MEYGYIVDSKVVACSFLHVEERVVGVVKESGEDALAYFSERFENYKNGVNALLEEIDKTTNKGSYLVKVQHLLNKIGDEQAIGDFEQIYNKLKAVEEQILLSVEANRVKNKQIKITLLEQLRNLADKQLVPSDVDVLHKLKYAWTRVGKAGDETDAEMGQEYEKCLQVLDEKQKEIAGLLQELIDTRVESFNYAISRAEKLLADGKFVKNTAEFKNIQAEVREIGFIPKEQNDALWQKFNALGNSFFAELKKEFENRKKVKTTTGNVLPKKQELLQQAEKLSAMSLQEALPLSVELKKAYKTIGFSKAKQEKEIDSLFYKAIRFVEETSFVDSLFRKRIKNYDTLSESEKRSKQLKMLNEMIAKDSETLAGYEQSVVKISVSGSFNSVVEKRKRELLLSLENKKRMLDSLKKSK